MNEAQRSEEPRSTAKLELRSVTRRKIFVCIHCTGIYADQPVTQCDCMEGTGSDFVEGWAEYPALSSNVEVSGRGLSRSA